MLRVDPLCEKQFFFFFLAWRIGFRSGVRGHTQQCLGAISGSQLMNNSSWCLGIHIWCSGLELGFLGSKADTLTPDYLSDLFLVVFFRLQSENLCLLLSLANNAFSFFFFSFFSSFFSVLFIVNAFSLITVMANI